jgi:GNAT superfamily N-acetyltransferase
MIRIRELDKERLKEVCDLADKVFEGDLWTPHEEIKASIDSTTFNIYKNRTRENFSWIKYWYAVDEAKDVVVGVVGLYDQNHDKEEACWLGWFCVDPEFEGQGAGEILLSYAANYARRIGRRYQRLYTSNIKRYSHAQMLYIKKGFRIKTEKGKINTGDEETEFFREMRL